MSSQAVGRIVTAVAGTLVVVLLYALIHPLFAGSAKSDSSHATASSSASPSAQTGSAVIRGKSFSAKVSDGYQQTLAMPNGAITNYQFQKGDDSNSLITVAVTEQDAHGISRINFPGGKTVRLDGVEAEELTQGLDPSFSVSVSAVRQDKVITVVMSSTVLSSAGQLQAVMSSIIDSWRWTS